MMQLDKYRFPNIKYLFFLYAELRTNKEYKEYVNLYSHEDLNNNGKNLFLSFIYSYKQFIVKYHNSFTPFQYARRLIIQLLTSGSDSELNTHKVESLYIFLKNVEEERSLELIKSASIMNKSCKQLLENEYNPYVCIYYLIMLDINMLGFNSTIVSWKESLVDLLPLNSFFYARSSFFLSKERRNQLKDKFNCQFCLEKLDKKLLAGTILTYKGKRYDLTLNGGFQRMLKN